MGAKRVHLNPSTTAIVSKPNTRKSLIVSGSMLFGFWSSLFTSHLRQDTELVISTFNAIQTGAVIALDH